MDIDELIRLLDPVKEVQGFSTLLDIDELIRTSDDVWRTLGFSTLLDIDELIHIYWLTLLIQVLVLCWILMNLYFTYYYINKHMF